MFTQAPLQGRRGATHRKPQADEVHVATAPAGAEHAWSQAPQFSALVVRFTHAPLHGVRPAAHDVRHPVTVHSCAAVLAVAHSPQWLESAARSTQSPLQFV
jgi:hypothetical protein